jgi:hypothetical protein
MTDKKTPKTTAASYTQIGSTSYILLPDGSFARKLKPVIVNGVSYYNLSKGKGKLKRISAAKVADFLSAIDNPTPAKHNDTL